jgi:hypothetical protein
MHTVSFPQLKHMVPFSSDQFHIDSWDIEIPHICASADIEIPHMCAQLKLSTMYRIGVHPA